MGSRNEMVIGIYIKKIKLLIIFRTEIVAKNGVLYRLKIKIKILPNEIPLYTIRLSKWQLNGFFITIFLAF